MHPIPTDLQAARALSGSPAALDLYNWLMYRCHIAKREERIPLCGPFGLTAQLGIAEYARPRKFRERLEQRLRLVNLMWPECPAHISNDGRGLNIRPRMRSTHRSELDASTAHRQTRRRLWQRDRSRFSHRSVPASQAGPAGSSPVSRFDPKGLNRFKGAYSHYSGACWTAKPKSREHQFEQ